MDTKIVYAYNADGKYVGRKTLDKTDKSPISGVWQIPANCTEITPPNVGDGQEAIFDGTKWTLQDISTDKPTPEYPESDEPVIMDTEPVSPETVQMAETIIDLYDNIESLNARIAVLEGGENNG